MTIEASSHWKSLIEIDIFPHYSNSQYRIERNLLPKQSPKCVPKSDKIVFKMDKEHFDFKTYYSKLTYFMEHFRQERYLNFQER